MGHTTPSDPADPDRCIRDEPYLLSAAALLLVAPAAAQRLIAFDADRSGNTAYQLDPLTAARTALGPMLPSTVIPGALAYDVGNGRLFLADTAGDSLYLVDVTNWNARLVGSFGNPAVLMHGMEYDPVTGTLYAISAHDSGLYTVDTTTGLATLVGTTGLAANLTWALNLVYDLTTLTMYMTSTATDSLYTIDLSTGAATLVGPMTGTTNISSLAFCLTNLTLYGIDNLADVLYTIDRSTGAATAIGSVGATNMIGFFCIDGAGSLAREAHACGPTTIVPTGNPAVGSTLTFELGNVTGLPLIGFGLSSATTPFCGCTIGHEWASVSGGAAVSLTIPANPIFTGVQLRVQGVDLTGVGGCVSPAFTATDTIVVTIG